MWPTNKEKQIIEMNIIKVKNPSWQKADQLAIYKRGQGVDSKKFYSEQNPASS